MIYAVKPGGYCSEECKQYEHPHGTYRCPMHDRAFLAKLKAPKKEDFKSCSEECKNFPHPDGPCGLVLEKGV